MVLMERLENCAKRENQNLTGACSRSVRGRPVCRSLKEKEGQGRRGRVVAEREVWRLREEDGRAAAVQALRRVAAAWLGTARALVRGSMALGAS